jgi:hypothetical protein
MDSLTKVSVECMQSMMLAVKPSGSIVRGLDEPPSKLVDERLRSRESRLMLRLSCLMPARMVCSRPRIFSGGSTQIIFV